MIAFVDLSSGGLNFASNLSSKNYLAFRSGTVSRFRARHFHNFSFLASQDLNSSSSLTFFLPRAVSIVIFVSKELLVAIF